MYKKVTICVLFILQNSFSLEHQTLFYAFHLRRSIIYLLLLLLFIIIIDDDNSVKVLL
jgi:hypothetical protein